MALEVDETRKINKLYELVYKSYDIMLKNVQDIDFDAILDLVFNYLELNLAWVGVLEDNNLEISKAKGKAINYILDSSLRNYQLEVLHKYKGKVFVSNDVINDKRINYIKQKALEYNFQSIFATSFDLENSKFVFLVLYSNKKNYFNEHLKEILTNFAFGIKTSLNFKELTRQLHLYKEIIQSSNQGIIITDKENKIIYANDAFTNITGYSFKEVKGKNPSILKSGYHKEEFYKNMWHKIIHDGSFEGKIYNKRKDGQVYEEMIFIKPLKDKNGKIVNYFSFFINLTELKKTQEQLNFYIYHDPLTNLINTSGFYEQAQRIAELNESFAIVYIDIDDFLTINAKFGIEKADKILKELSNFLKKEIVGPKDIVGRFGSDEFVLLKRSIIEQTVIKFVQDATEKIRQKVFIVDNQEVFLKVSAGIVLYPKDSSDINTLVNYAQAACRKAKQLGKNQCVFFNSAIYEEFKNNFVLTNEILHGIELKEFELYFQPIYNTKSKNITNAEALVRWNHPERGLLSPYFFIPFAQNSYLIEKIDFYVLEEACKAVKKLKDNGINIILSVNVTGRTFLRNDFVEEFEKLLKKYQINNNMLKIELTESIALEDKQKTKEYMQRLNNMNITFSMDDFGTGYSSVLSLKEFSFNNIKLDANFVMDSQNNKESAIISSHLLKMLNDLNFETTAEGVENEYLFFVFSFLHCDLLQGYYISKPINFNEFIHFVKNFTIDRSFLEFTKISKRVSDFDLANVKFYLYKWYKILSQVVETRLTQQDITDFNNIINTDYTQCDFGKWYYSLYPTYSKIENFKDMESIHTQIHNIGKKILSSNNQQEIEEELSNLTNQLALLNSMVDNFYLEYFRA